MKYTSDGTSLWIKSYADDILPERIYFNGTGFKIVGTYRFAGRVLEFDLTGNLLQSKNYGVGENKSHLFIFDNTTYLIEVPEMDEEAM